MQPLYNFEKKNKAYSELKFSHTKLLNNSDIWNWNTMACLTRPSLERLLYLNNIYQLAINTPGDIFEFGSHYGASTSILNNLKRIYEPNSIRRIHTFDTFNGFENIDEEDEGSSEVTNQVGDFKPQIVNYEKFLEKILLLHESLDSSVSNKSSFSLNKGLIEKTLPKFFEENNSVFISLAIFDMDLYEPTLNSLEVIKPHLLNGSYLVFDELLGYEQFPGESLAVKNCSFKENLFPVDIFPKVSASAIFVYKNL